MFDKKLASFTAFSDDFDDATSHLGELTFPHIQLPLKHLDITSTEVKCVDIRANNYDFLLPLADGQLIVTFQWRWRDNSLFEQYYTHMSCHDQLGRLMGAVTVERYVQQGKVAQCGPNEFVMCVGSDNPELVVCTTPT